MPTERPNCGLVALGTILAILVEVPLSTFLRLAVAAAPAFAIGCSNMLGLDSLSYDKKSDEVKQGTGGTAGVDDDAAGLLDDAGTGGTVSIEAAQVVQLGSNAQLVASVSKQATFHVYQASSGQLVSYLASDVGLVATTRSWRAGWTLVVEKPTPPSSALLGYESGQFQLIEDWLEQDELAAALQPGNSGWTSILAYLDAGAAGLLSYDAGEGDYRFGGDTTTVGVLEPGFDQVVACPSVDDPTFVAYATATNSLALLGITATGDALEVRARDDWGPESGVDWELVSCVGPSSAPRLVRYDADFGKVQVGKLSFTAAPEGDVPQLVFTTDDEGVWPQHYVSLTPVVVDGHIGVVGYDGDSGLAGLFGLDPLETGSQVVK